MNVRRFEVTNQIKYLSLDAIKQGIATPAVSRWAYILHDKDDAEAHYHVMVWLSYPCDTFYIAKWFGVEEQFVNKMHSECGALEYLTHKNAPDKYQYADSEVVSNFNIQQEIEKQKKKKSRDARLAEIINGIDAGTIREFNLHDYVTAVEYNSYRRGIENAFAYRKMKLREQERNMQCIFITGQSGSGKTTYAKQIAQEHGFSVFVSSGSNDVLDGYAGQECIILDDLRPSCMGLSDLLKMLDNNTSSTVKSRYFNKVLECKMIIITTTKSLETFFSEVFEKENESAIQLMRRCETVVEMDTDKIVFKVWQKKSRQYKAFRSIDNFVLDSFKVDDMTEAEALDKLSSLLHLSVDVVDELKNNGAEYLDGQLQLSDNPF